MILASAMTATAANPKPDKKQPFSIEGTDFKIINGRIKDYKVFLKDTPFKGL